MGLCPGALRNRRNRPIHTGRGDGGAARQSRHELAPAERRTCKRHRVFAAAHTTFERPALFAFVFFHATSSAAIFFRTSCLDGPHQEARKTCLPQMVRRTKEPAFCSGLLNNEILYARNQVETHQTCCIAKSTGEEVIYRGATKRKGLSARPLLWSKRELASRRSGVHEQAR